MKNEKFTAVDMKEVIPDVHKDFLPETLMLKKLK